MIERVNEFENHKWGEERKRVKIFLVQDGVEIEQISSELKFDENMMPRIRIVENRMEIGFGEYFKRTDGSIELKLTLVGEYKVNTNNISGFAQMEGFIPESLRKD